MSIPDYSAVRTSMKVAGGRPISPSQRKDGRDPLFETMELTMLELHQAPAASAKTEQEKKDLLAQLDLLRMAVEQLTVYRMVRVCCPSPSLRLQQLSLLNTPTPAAQRRSLCLSGRLDEREIGTFNESIRLFAPLRRRSKGRKSASRNRSLLRFASIQRLISK